MANIYSFPNNQTEYTGAEHVMRWLHGRTSGVFAADDNAAVAPSGDNMNITVSDGIGWLADEKQNGIVWWNNLEEATDAKLELTVGASDSTLNRIDRVVVTWTTTNYVALPTITILSGVLAAAPVPPALTNNSTTRQISLAQISVPAGTTAIDVSLITDERQNPSVCGIVTDSLSVDTSVINAQYEALLEELRVALAEALEGDLGDALVVDRVREQNELGALKFWIGTKEEKEAATVQEDTMYIITDDEPFVVVSLSGSFTDGGAITSDKTITEIWEAYDDGKVLMGKTSGVESGPNYVYYLYALTSGYAAFVRADRGAAITLTSGNSGTYSLIPAEEKEAFIVEITGVISDGGAITSDKTITEINDAYNNNKIIIAKSSSKDSDKTYYLTSLTSSNAVFACRMPTSVHIAQLTSTSTSTNTGSYTIIYDPEPELFTVTFTGTLANGTVVFSNTAAEIYEAYSAGKLVIGKFPATTINNESVFYLSEITSSMVHFVNLQSGAIVHVILTGTGTSGFSSVVEIPDEVPVDTITETLYDSPTTGWSWRKYNSNIIEAWQKITLEDITIATDALRSSMQAISLPTGLFTKAPKSVQVSVDNFGWAIGVAASQTAVNFYICRQAGGTLDFNCYLHVIGE